ncbi:MAG: twin-arginine translocation signal domain-containing protein, partial [Caldilineaceae bacterium]|nr:twin-arginine translocation signal domain-containing protein [Caldilineaceae bacterium]
MKSQQLSRRGLLKMLGAGTATLALAACAPAAGPAAAPESGSSGDATSEKIQMSVATFAAVLHDWQREFAKRWGEEHADQVDLQIEEVV